MNTNMLSIICALNLTDDTTKQHWKNMSAISAGTQATDSQLAESMGKRSSPSSASETSAAKRPRTAGDDKANSL